NENQNLDKGPLTLDQLVKYGKEVLLPATLDQMIKYNQEVLLPAFDKRLERFATKDDLSSLSMKLVPLEEFDNFKKEIKEEFSELRSSINSLTNSIDGLVKTLDKLNTEYMAIKNQISRHEKWFEKVAQKLDMKLEY
ncbi:hypothetical protein KKA24_02125, partial [Patescibacteria group bacterium]|nr:hypothetical protein [Patescibacteria group bacterium]